MTKQLQLELDENLIKEATTVFDYYGLDIQTGVKMFLKRVVNDKTVSFLFEQLRQTPEKPEIYNKAVNDDLILGDDNFKMTKNGAKRLFLKNGYEIFDTTTFASKNRSAYNYWANPNKDVLYKHWSLILNDTLNRKLYLFNIPPKAIEKLTLRADNSELIDLQIMYNDSTFTDNRSQVSFLKFKEAEISY